jgi:dihydrofolate synthase/folylpolyglutamate synthase
MSITDPAIPSSLAQPSKEIEFLFNRINYERRSVLAYNEQRMRLENMRRLLEKLGDPHQRLSIVHIAGTKGKGSVATMVSSILAESDLRVGTYTSPHLHALNERFLINNSPIDSTELDRLIRVTRPHLEDLDQDAIERGDPFGRPTFFEITTAIAFLHFAQQQVDYAVIEVGLGGRLDSTNICTPRLSIITSISYDHTRQLGETLPEIAGEKAGIIKSGIPLICGVEQPEISQLIARRAADHKSACWQLGVDFQLRPSVNRSAPLLPTGQLPTHNLPQEDHTQAQTEPGELFSVQILNRDISDVHTELQGLRTAMPGAHQQRNAAIAIASCKFLQKTDPRISQQAIGTGLAGARLAGRIEQVCAEPRIVVDVAHNVASAIALIETLQPAVSSSTLIYATSRDKDFHGVLQVLLPHFSRVHFTRFLENPRARAPAELLAEATEITKRQPDLHWEFHLHLNPQDALQAALDQPSSNEQPTSHAPLICITGSAFIVAELRNLCSSNVIQKRKLDSKI